MLEVRTVLHGPGINSQFETIFLSLVQQGTEFITLYPIPETHTKSQATKHGCLPSLLGEGNKGVKIVLAEEKNIFVLGRLEQPRQNKILFYLQNKHMEPTKEGPLSHVLFESPFTSVSTVNRGRPSLVSLPCTTERCDRVTARNYTLEFTDKILLLSPRAEYCMLEIRNTNIVLQFST